MAPKAKENQTNKGKLEIKLINKPGKQSGPRTPVPLPGCVKYGE